MKENMKKPEIHESFRPQMDIYPDLLKVNEKLVTFPIPDLEHGVYVKTAGAGLQKRVVRLKENSSIADFRYS